MKIILTYQNFFKRNRNFFLISSLLGLLFLLLVIWRIKKQSRFTPITLEVSNSKNNDVKIFDLSLADRNLFIKQFVEFAKKRDKILELPYSKTDVEYSQEATNIFNFYYMMPPLIKTKLDSITLPVYDYDDSRIDHTIKYIKILNKPDNFLTLNLFTPKKIQQLEIEKILNKPFIQNSSIEFENLELLFKFLEEINITYVVGKIWIN